MMTFVFVAVLAILGFLCFTGPTVLSAQGIVTESSERERFFSGDQVVE